MLKLLGLQSFSQLSGLYEQKYPISYPALNIAPCGTRKVIPRVRQRLRLLVLADTADKRVAEVVGQGPDEGLGGWLRVCMFFLRDIAYVYINIDICLYTMNIYRDWCIIYIYCRIFWFSLFRWWKIVPCEKWYRILWTWEIYTCCVCSYLFLGITPIMIPAHSQGKFNQKYAVIHYVHGICP